MGKLFGFDPSYPGQVPMSSAEMATMGSPGLFHQPQDPRPVSYHVPQPEKGPSVPLGSTVILLPD